MTTSPSGPLVHKHRWFQFSLRSLMLLMFLASIGMSWVAVKLQQGRRQGIAVEEIEKLGGRIEYEYEVRAYQNGFRGPGKPSPPELWERLGVDYFAHILDVDLPSSITDADLEHLKEYLGALAPLKVLSLGRSHVTDTGMRYLAGLKQIETFNLDGTQVGDAGLEHLATCTQLRSIDLSGTKITDAGLRHLEGMQQLRALILSGTQVTDAGLEHLKGLEKLEGLFLEGTEITDAGLASLEGHKRLKFLNLTGTAVTNEGVKRLRKACPNCQIVK